MLTNQVTTKISKDPLSLSHLAMALGVSWEHSCTHRIVMYFKGSKRIAEMTKSSDRPLQSQVFTIVKEGIRSASLDDVHVDLDSGGGEW